MIRLLVLSGNMPRKGPYQAPVGRIDGVERWPSRRRRSTASRGTSTDQAICHETLNRILTFDTYQDMHVSSLPH